MDNNEIMTLYLREEKDSMKKIFIVFFISLWILPGCIQEKKQEKEFTPIVKIGVVSDYGESTKFEYSGRVVSASKANLAFRVSGKISHIAVGQGDYVRQGQLLAEIDDRDYRTQLKATEAEYTQIKAEAERVINLYNKESVTRSDYDKAVAGLTQISSKYEAHKNALADTRLYAPFDAYVQELKYEENEMVAQGYPVISIIGAGTPEIEINIPASDYIRRNDFKSFSASIELFPQEIFPLQLISISQKANLNQLYTMRLSLHPNHKGPIPTAGMYANVVIDVAQKKTSEGIIPLSAIFEYKGNSAVWVFNEKTERITPRIVVPSEILLNGMVIIDKGVVPGEKIVVAGVHSLSEGQKVRTLSTENKKTNKGGML